MDYAQSSPGGGVIFYTKVDRENATCLVGIGLRKPLVGEGSGISTGGFSDCDEHLKKPIGHYTLLQDEVYREACEELIGFETLMTRETFIKRLEPVIGFTVRTPDANKLHSPFYYGMHVTRAEQQVIEEQLEESDEHIGVVFVPMRWNKELTLDTLEEGISVSLPEPLFHKHEIVAFQWLAWGLQQGTVGRDF